MILKFPKPEPKKKKKPDILKYKRYRANTLQNKKWNERKKNDYNISCREVL